LALGDETAASQRQQGNHFIRDLLSSAIMSADYLFAVFDDEKAASQVVSEIIGESLNAFEQRIDEMFLSTLDVPYATEMALMKVQKLIELAMLGHDGLAMRDDEQLEVLVPDGEPSPSTIDSWARGTGTPTHFTSAYISPNSHLRLCFLLQLP
jgi:hypothetical protein